jgi:hypothetical protein
MQSESAAQGVSVAHALEPVSLSEPSLVSAESSLVSVLSSAHHGSSTWVTLAGHPGPWMGRERWPPRHRASAKRRSHHAESVDDERRDRERAHEVSQRL